ncbi:MAG: hypothetical protein AB7N24_23785 [Dehalococcoidia bacterium]
MTRSSGRAIKRGVGLAVAGAALSAIVYWATSGSRLNADAGPVGDLPSAVIQPRAALGSIAGKLPKPVPQDRTSVAEKLPVEPEGGDARTVGQVAEQVVDEHLDRCPPSFEDAWFRVSTMAIHRGVGLPRDVLLRDRDWRTLEQEIGPLVAEMKSLDRQKAEILSPILDRKIRLRDGKFWPAQGLSDEEERRIANESAEVIRTVGPMDSVTQGFAGGERVFIRTQSTESPELHAVMTSIWEVADRAIARADMLLRSFPQRRASDRGR